MILENQIAAGRTAPLTATPTNAGVPGFVDGAMADGRDAGESIFGGDGGPRSDGPALGNQPSIDRRSAPETKMDKPSFAEAHATAQTSAKTAAVADRSDEIGGDQGGMSGLAGLVLSQVAVAGATDPVRDGAALASVPGLPAASISGVPPEPGVPGGSDVPQESEPGVAKADSGGIGSAVTGSDARIAGFTAEIRGNVGVGVGHSESGVVLASVAQQNRVSAATPQTEPAMVRIGGEAGGAATPAKVENATKGTVQPDRTSAETVQPLARPVWAMSKPGAEAVVGGASAAGLVSAEMIDGGSSGRVTGTVEVGTAQTPQAEISGNLSARRGSVTADVRLGAGVTDNGPDGSQEPGLDAANKTAGRATKGGHEGANAPNQARDPAVGQAVDTAVPMREAVLPNGPSPAFGQSEGTSAPGASGPGAGAQAGPQPLNGGPPVAATDRTAPVGLPEALTGGLGTPQDTPSAPGDGASPKAGRADQNTPAAPAQAFGIGEPAKQGGANPAPAGSVVSWRPGGEGRTPNQTPNPMPVTGEEAPSASAPIKVAAGAADTPDLLGTPGMPGPGAAGVQNADLFQRARDALDRDPLALDADPAGIVPDVGSARPGHAAAAAIRAQANILAPRLVQQITTAAVGLADGPVELRLNPEELGHVRLRLDTRDGAMAVLVTAERAETLDLLRRNIDQLAAGLRDVGYQELSFGFAGRDQAGSDGSRQESSAPASRGDRAPVQTTEAEPAARAAQVRTKSGVDIRL